MRFIAAVIVAVSVFVQADAQQECRNSIAERTQTANTAVVAEVKKVGPSPGFGSGIIGVRQDVIYAGKSTLKGKVPTEFTVQYYVVHGSKIAERDKPELSRSLFANGTKHLLFLNVRTVTIYDGTNCTLVDAVGGDCSILPLSSSNVDAVKKAVALISRR